MPLERKETIMTYWLPTEYVDYEEQPDSNDKRTLQAEPKFKMYTEEPDEGSVTDTPSTTTLEEKKDRELRKFMDSSQISDPLELIQRLSRMSAQPPKCESPSNPNGSSEQPTTMEKGLQQSKGESRKPSSSLFNADSEDKDYLEFLTNFEITAPQHIRYETS
ncbi:hypothetical protein RvY_14761 [Ramazzottius varieornatus]|uniref:Uncharacterized protein n=1 Tax=Ramazzottius varieornatus TaxID=947166 RepID=A0A1D1VU12_RAMVA|nr:hypothetical protein RvY_14761 [Ramazzottius varieornatus]